MTQVLDYNNVDRKSTHDPALLLDKLLDHYEEERKKALKQIAPIMNDVLKDVSKKTEEKIVIAEEIQRLNQVLNNEKSTSQLRQSAQNKRDDLIKKLQYDTKDRPSVFKAYRLLTDYRISLSQSSKKAKAIKRKNKLIKMSVNLIGLILAFSLEPVISSLLKGILRLTLPQFAEYLTSVMGRCVIILIIYFVEKYIFDRFLDRFNRKILWDLIDELKHKLRDELEEIHKMATEAVTTSHDF